MERNWALLQEILIAVEQGKATFRSVPTNAQLLYHLRLAKSGGLIDTAEPTGPTLAELEDLSAQLFACTEPLLTPVELTWTGHNFLDTIRTRTGKDLDHYMAARAQESFRQVTGES